MTTTVEDVLGQMLEMVMFWILTLHIAKEISGRSQNRFGMIPGGYIQGTNFTE